MKKISISIFISLLILSAFIGCATKSTSIKKTTDLETPVSVPKPNAPYKPEEREVIYYDLSTDMYTNPSLKAGETYKFHAEGKSKYFIIAPTNHNVNTWNVVENDGSNVFEKEVTIPVDALSVSFAFSGSNQRFETSYANIVVVDNYVPELIIDTGNLKRVIADVPCFTYKEKLIGGDFYEICAGNNSKNYLNVAFTTGDKWLTYAIEKNEEGYFQKVIQVPADATKMTMTFHEKAYWISGGGTFGVIKSPEKYPEIISYDEETVLYFKAPMVDCDLKLETGKFLKIYLSPLVHDYVSASGSKKVNGEDVNIMWQVVESNKEGYSLIEAFLPQTKGNLYLHGRNSKNEWENNLAQFTLTPSKMPYKFSTTSDYDSLKKYKTKKPDERLINYMASIDARELGKKDPDLLISMTVEKINELKQDEYEKVKLVHDAVWYLVSYDSDSLAIGRDLPQDYKSVLERGTSVCAGFAEVFTQFCKVAEIKEIQISGYARGTGKFNESWKPTDDPTQSNHAWNMVMIEKQWYLVDSTWDSGHTHNNIRDDYYSNAYIFVKPEEFIYSHYPSYNSDFQLLNKPYSPKEFSELPFKRPGEM